MTQETAAGDARSNTLKSLLPMVHAVALAVVLVAAGVMAAAVFSLRSDVDALAGQARRAAKSAKAAGQELAAIEADLDRHIAPAELPAGSDAVTAVAQRETGPLRVSFGGLRPLTAHGPIPVCIFKAGDPDLLAACIKRGMARKTRS